MVGYNLSKIMEEREQDFMRTLEGKEDSIKKVLYDIVEYNSFIDDKFRDENNVVNIIEYLKYLKDAEQQFRLLLGGISNDLYAIKSNKPLIEMFSSKEEVEILDKFLTKYLKYKRELDGVGDEYLGY